MLILYQLRPLIWMCQLSGLLPFYMEFDPDTKKFRKFSFSWKRPMTWWFVFLCIGQFAFLIFDIRISWIAFYQNDVIKSNIPKVFSAFLFVEHLLFVFLIDMARFMILKYSNLRCAVHLIQKVHNMLSVDNKLSFEKSLKVKRHLISGLIVTAICVKNQNTS